MTAGIAAPVVDTWEVSNSEISTYRQCRRKWWLAYVMRLATKKSTVVGPLPLGSRVHKALELYYRDNIPLMDAHRELVEEDRIEMLLDGLTPPTLDGDAELGRIMLEGYLDWVANEGLDDDLEMLGTEEILQYPMLKDQVTLMGKLDLRVLKKTENLRLVQDFKTTQSFNQFNETGHMLNQLKIYQLLDMLTGTPGQRIEGGAFRLLKKVKRTTRAMPALLPRSRHSTQRLRTAVILGPDPGNPDRHGAHSQRTAGRRRPIGLRLSECHVASASWDCAFHVICPLFDDGSDVDAGD
jgi:RecB family exonuclease